MRSLLALCLLAIAVPSSAMVVRSPNSTECGSSTSTEDIIGAIYFTTNEPNGNYIISSAFGSDGKLYSQQAIATGGFGGRDLDPPGEGELFSSGVVEPSPLGVISESDPSSLTPIGTPVWSRGEFPISVTFNNAGNVLCALNTGALNGISCFNVDKTEGLMPISDTTRYLHLNQTSPLSGPVSGSASQVTFSEDNQLLIVAVKGLNGTTDAGYLAVWEVYENFTLSQDFHRVALPTGGFYPYSLMTIPGQNAVLVTDPALGYEIFTNVSGSSNTGEHRNIGVGSYARTIPNQLTTCWSAYSPISENYYLSDLADNRIAMISIDGNLNSTIVNYISLGKNFGPLDMATVSIKGQGFLYVLSTTPQAVDVFSVDKPGKAVHIQRFDYTAFAKSAGITLHAKYLAGMSSFTWKQ
ncbi:hypothetical protein F5887DRAFT_1243106 [Amanita rubescens]|nr:hypothetical protein F5887DRAFT_1243106 [Amanita rubescens]